MGYPIVIATLNRGTWYAAAERYRAWALQQPWCERGTRRGRVAAGDSSRWLLETTGAVGAWWPFRNDIRADILAPAASTRHHSCTWSSGGVTGPRTRPPGATAITSAPSISRSSPSRADSRSELTARTPSSRWRRRSRLTGSPCARCSRVGGRSCASRPRTWPARGP